MFQLLPSLDQEITTFGYLDRDPFSRIARPDVQAWVAGLAVYSQEVKISVEPSQDLILLTIFDEIRGCRGQ